MIPFQVKLTVGLTDRFPNQRNMLILYARFTLIVLADADAARKINERIGEIPEAEVAQNEQGNQVQQKSMDEKSIGSSRASGSQSSRETRLNRQKRSLMDHRLQAPAASFLKMSTVFTVIFLLLIVGVTILGYIVIASTDKGILVF